MGIVTVPVQGGVCSASVLPMSVKSGQSLARRSSQLSLHSTSSDPPSVLVRETMLLVLGLFRIWSSGEYLGPLQGSSILMTNLCCVVEARLSPRTLLHCSILTKSDSHVNRQRAVSLRHWRCGVELFSDQSGPQEMSD